MIISYTMLEETSKHDPFYLQNLMYDRPDIEATPVTLKITIPKNFSAYIIDDLHFVDTNNNTVELLLEENATVTYQFFVANHELCDLCERRKEFDCQALPEIFEKNLLITLAERGGQAYVKCHYLGDDSSVFKLSTQQRHLASDTTSTVTVKSVLDDAAHFVSENRVFVETDLDGVIAEQMNKNLLLSDRAHVITTPILDINSNEAACRHGATMSGLSQEELFYLESRGLSRDDATRTLIEAFLALN